MNYFLEEDTVSLPIHAVVKLLACLRAVLYLPMSIRNSAGGPSPFCVLRPGTYGPTRFSLAVLRVAEYFFHECSLQVMEEGGGAGGS